MRARLFGLRRWYCILWLCAIVLLVMRNLVCGLNGCTYSTKSQGHLTRHRRSTACAGAQGLAVAAAAVVAAPPLAPPIAPEIAVDVPLPHMPVEPEPMVCFYLFS
jgi:hypothetical protein